MLEHIKVEPFINQNFFVGFHTSQKYNEVFSKYFNVIKSKLDTSLQSLNFSQYLQIQLNSISFGNLSLSISDTKSINSMVFSNNEINCQFIESYDMVIFKTFNDIYKKIREKTIYTKSDYVFSKIDVFIIKTVREKIPNSETYDIISSYTFYNCIPINIILDNRLNKDDVQVLQTSVTFKFEYFTNTL